ncbi:hypothetical protein OIU79_002174 [Salix purpurea]|uniref:Uncharacterized protein n=1 Tax=Salix purpurea TaxID=77065 RepID=A0A9Q0US23_SALPP|nr:hypothetical protein OIU79_002174 [Salix purpurea]
MIISFENKEILMFLHFRVHPQMVEHNWQEIISLFRMSRIHSSNHISRDKGNNYHRNTKLPFKSFCF